MTDPEDEDRTVIKAGPAGAARQPPVTHPSVAAAAAADLGGQHELPAGSRISEFEVTGLIGVGGFGIVYLAHDHSLGRKVALKEYMPSSLAARVDGVSVVVRSARDADTFDAGMRSFINEARLLAQFDHPSLVKVYRFWEANGTAYMVMPFYEGLTLKQALQGMSSPPSEEWLKALLVPLADALQVLHREDCFHRDIAPDNILLLKSGRPVLLDFGAARRVIGDMAKNLTVILKPGYAPIEQYAEDPGVSQGAWTDIYALAAVVRYAITGKPPAPSVTRVMSDTMVPLVTSAKGRYSERFLRAIDAALAVRPEQRPQTVEELRGQLELGAGAPEHEQPRAAVRPTPPAVQASAKKSSAFPLLAGAVALVLVLAVAAFFVLTRGGSTPKPELAVAPAAPSALPTPVPTPAALPTPVPAAVTPFAPVDALVQLFDGRDSAGAVTVALDSARVKISKDTLRFRVQSAKPGYLYIFLVGTDKTHIHLLFPNQFDNNNRLAAGKDMSLPGKGWSMTAEGPPGVDQFVAMVSEHPRDFREAGLAKLGPFSEFPLDKVEARMRSNPGAAAVLAGSVVCAAGVVCSDAYGAARFSIEEIE